MIRISDIDLYLNPMERITVQGEPFFDSTSRKGTTKKEDSAMAKSIRWLPDVNAAKKEAREEHKYVLLDFFNPR